VTGAPHLSVDRADMADLISHAMTGRRSTGRNLPFDMRTGTVKTYALEVNVPEEDVEHAARRIRELAEIQGLTYATSRDPGLLLAWGNDVSLFVDVFDPRFWLIHTTSSAGRVQALLRTVAWKSTDIDWCWFPGASVRRMQNDGETRWFKSDFRGDDLLASQVVEARRLKVQLEGDQAQRLFDLLVQNPAYRSSAALTAIALRLGDSNLGHVDEAAYYRGRFVARGDSFELHVGFVAKWVREYAAAVRAIERDHRIAWAPASEEGPFSYSGRPITVNLGRPITDLDQFAAALFSCRDPFRMWAVPRASGPDAIEAEVVDLHLGQQLRMDISREWIRIYLPHDACGNTIFRLVSNLQHRYDASVEVPPVGDA
jgi:hypothetical protein